MQRSSVRLVARLGIFGIVICLSVVAAYGILRHDWIAGLLSGITLAIAMVPEEFPMVLAIFMLSARGGWPRTTFSSDGPQQSKHWGL